MTPVERAAQIYQAELCAHTFREDMEFYLLNGFVFSRPDFFVMGRPVVSVASQEQITGHHRFPSRGCDCWHIHLAAGNLPRMWAMLPWDMAIISFERKNELRFLKLSTMRRLSSLSNI
jgi:hypothetical protein